MNIKPVIVLGNARSGTTWLSNLVVTNFKFVSPFHPLHYGIIETNLLRNKIYFESRSWNKNTDAFYNCIIPFLGSDLFTSTGLSKEKFLSFDFKHRGFYDLFFDLLDDLAISRNSSGWITKLDPLFYVYRDELRVFTRCLHDRYKEVKYISIIRPYHDNLKSYINVTGPKFSSRQLLIRNVMSYLLGAARYRYFNSSIENYMGVRKGLRLSYSDLGNADIASRLALFLQEEIVLAELGNIPPNTSSQNQGRKYLVWLGTLSRWVTTSTAISRIIVAAYEAFRKSFNPMKFRIIASQHNSKHLVEYLTAMGDQLLIQYVEASRSREKK